MKLRTLLETIELKSYLGNLNESELFLLLEKSIPDCGNAVTTETPKQVLLNPFIKKKAAQQLEAHAKNLEGCKDKIYDLLIAHFKKDEQFEDASDDVIMKHINKLISKQKEHVETKDEGDARLKKEASAKKKATTKKKKSWFS